MGKRDSNTRELVREISKRRKRLPAGGLSCSTAVDSLQGGSCAPLERQLWFWLLSQEQTTLERGRLVARKVGRRGKCRERRKREGEEQQRGRSQVTKSRHIPDKPLHRIATPHHTENNALILGEGGPYLHTHPTCSYQRRYKLELPHHTWTTANWRNGMRERCVGYGWWRGGLFWQKLNPLWCQGGKGKAKGEKQPKQREQEGAGKAEKLQEPFT